MPHAGKVVSEPTTAVEASCAPNWQELSRIVPSHLLATYPRVEPRSDTWLFCPLARLMHQCDGPMQTGVTAKGSDQIMHIDPRFAFDIALFAAMTTFAFVLDFALAP